MTMLNLRIPEELDKRLNELANSTGRTKSYYVRQALEQRIEELEDFYMAMNALEDAQLNKGKVWSQEDLEAGRDLED